MLKIYNTIIILKLCLKIFEIAKSFCIFTQDERILHTSFIKGFQIFTLKLIDTSPKILVKHYKSELT